MVFLFLLAFLWEVMVRFNFILAARRLNQSSKPSNSGESSSLENESESESEELLDEDEGSSPPPVRCFDFFFLSFFFNDRLTDAAFCSSSCSLLSSWTESVIDIAGIGVGEQGMQNGDALGGGVVVLGAAGAGIDSSLTFCWVNHC